MLVEDIPVLDPSACGTPRSAPMEPGRVSAHSGAGVLPLTPKRHSLSYGSED